MLAGVGPASSAETCGVSYLLLLPRVLSAHADHRDQNHQNPDQVGDDVQKRIFAPDCASPRLRRRNLIRLFPFHDDAAVFEQLSQFGVSRVRAGLHLNLRARASSTCDCRRSPTIPCVAKSWTPVHPPRHAASLESSTPEVDPRESSGKTTDSVRVAGHVNGTRDAGRPFGTVGETPVLAARAGQMRRIDREARGGPHCAGRARTASATRGSRPGPSGTVGRCRTARGTPTG